MEFSDTNVILPEFSSGLCETVELEMGRFGAFAPLPPHLREDPRAAAAPPGLLFPLRCASKSLLWDPPRVLARATSTKAKGPTLARGPFALVEVARLELETFCTSSRRSTQLSYTSVLNCGGDNRIRTCDLLRVEQAL